MGVSARAVKAINAMKDMGISEKKVKPVLKDLLRLYDKNWELIEDDNYAVLIEAIFEEKEEEATQKDEEEQLLEESAGPPLKKMCLRGNADAPSASSECELTLRWSMRESDDLPMAQSVERDPILSQVKDKDVQEALALPSTLSRPDEEEQSQLCLRDRSANHPISHQSVSRDKGKDPILPSVVYCRDKISQSCTHTGQNVARHDPTSPQTQLETKEMERSSLQMTHNEKGCLQARPSFAERFKEQKIETRIILAPKKKLDDGLIKPKNEPFDDHSHLEVPLAVMPPIISEGTIDIARHDPTSPQTQLERKEMECSFLQMTHNEKGCLQARPSFAERFKEQKIETGIILAPKKELDNGLIKPNNEPLDDLSHLEVPLAVMSPIISKGTIDIDLVVEDGHSTLNGSSVQVNGVESLACKDNHNVNCDKACESAMGSELATVPESPMNFDIASSLLGEVKICLSCSQSIKRPGVHMPSVDEVLKAVEDRCLRSYRILDPNFSILKLFQETCQSFLDLSSQQDRIQLPTSFSDGSSNGQPSAEGVLKLRRSNIEGDDLPIAQGVDHNPLLSQMKGKDLQEALALPSALSRPDEEKQYQSHLRDRSEHQLVSPQSLSGNQGINPMLPSSICHREEILQSCTHTTQNVANQNTKPDDYSLFEVPIAVLPPANSEEIIDFDGDSTLNGSTVQANGVESLASKDNQIDNPDRACEATSSELATVPETPLNFEVASSTFGEVKISLSCCLSFERPGVHVPSLDEVLKAVEDKCLRSHHILDPNFSIMNLFQETCQSFLDLSSQQDKVQLTTSFSDGSNGQKSAEAVSTLKRSNMEGDDLPITKIDQFVEKGNSTLNSSTVEVNAVESLEDQNFNPCEECEAGYSTLNGSTVQVNGIESLASKESQIVNPDNECEAVMSSDLATVPDAPKAVMSSDLATVPEAPMSFEIASSPLGQVKICLSCSQSFQQSGVYVPSLDEVLKAVEDKCLRSYRILDPNFSIMKLFQETCQSFLDLGSQQDKILLPTSFSDESSNRQPSAEAVLPEPSNMLLLSGLESHHNPQTDGNCNGEMDMQQPSWM